MNSYRKAKTVAKDMLVHGSTLEKKVLDTMATISNMVGATLGPSGRPVLIERQEYGLPHIFTKDGVTVFRNLGFQDPTAHAIMEAARDASVRTASEAGDGTTTATVLAEAIVRNTLAYCKANPTISPQKVVRYLEEVFNSQIAPFIKQHSIPVDAEMLKSVAKLSANGDGELADAVMKCFDAIGDDGNIIINEQSGPSSYQVEFTKGYPIAMGYEESCGKLFPLFLNDRNNNRTFLEKPVFVLYFGAITQTQTIERLMQLIGSAWQDPGNNGLDKPFNYNVVIVATGFSESVLGDLSANFSHPHTINVFPLLTPRSPIQNGEMHLLYDLAAVTGATVFDPIGRPLENATLQDLGYGIQSFEATRYRSTILGLCDETFIEMRADELRSSLNSAESKFDATFIQERLAKLTSGIAKLKVIGPSNGELREKRDRAEDATFAVRGAKKHGCLPGGGWTLLKLTQTLEKNEINEAILFPSLLEPLNKMLTNCGLHHTEIEDIVQKLKHSDNVVYDAMAHHYVDPKVSGILDSTPAVLEAVRNSISIASILGTLGGSIVFKRDEQMELEEAASAMQAEKSMFGE